MLRIFIGFDARETAPYHVLAHSIQARASKPVAITPIDLRHLEGAYARPFRNQSTAFTYSRFLVPWLCQFRGYALFLDCDMLCLADPYELIEPIIEGNRQSTICWHNGDGEPCQVCPPSGAEKAVWVCQHDYIPKERAKFLGQPQIAYARKNWSSLMLFRNDLCRVLTPEYVNAAAPADLHRFAWTTDDRIGALPLAWNYLVGEENQSHDPPKILHFTNGGPWYREYAEGEHSKEWWREYDTMKAIG